MAIVKNFWLQGSSKRLAGAVLYEAMGQTRVRQLAAEVSNPRTEAQMNQRVKWANLVNLYKANASWMKYAYETKKPNQSEYNKFMSLNVTNSRIFLTKDIAAYGGAVVDAYVMTQGSLPSIEWKSADAQKVSNILIGANTDWSTALTIGTLSASLITNNPGIQSGDQLSFVRLTQLVNDSTGAPYVQVRRYEMIVDQTSAELVSKYLPTELFGNYEAEGIHYLSFVGAGKAGGYLMILSRTLGGKTYVSTQQVIIFNNEALIDNYSSNAALTAAIDSYGSSEDAFLSSNSASPAQTAPTALSLLGLLADGVVIPSGTLRRDMSTLAGTTQSYRFNAPLDDVVTVSAVVTDVYARTFTGTATVNQVDKSLVNVTWPTEELENNNARRLSTTITIDDLSYTYRYDITSGGLDE